MPFRTLITSAGIVWAVRARSSASRCIRTKSRFRRTVACPGGGVALPGSSGGGGGDIFGCCATTPMVNSRVMHRTTRLYTARLQEKKFQSLYSGLRRDEANHGCLQRCGCAPGHGEPQQLCTMPACPSALHTAVRMQNAGGHLRQKILSKKHCSSRCLAKNRNRFP